MRLVFLGSGAFGLPTLRALARAHEIALVVSQPDRPAGRGSKLTPTPIAGFAESDLPGVPLLKPENINDEAVRETVRAFDADAWAVIAFGQYLGSKLIADRFAINLHASLLPRWRGAAPINAAVLAGDTVTGNSVITIAKRMDAGLVLGQSRREIEPTQTAGELHDLLAEDGPALVDGVLRAHATGTLSPVEQDESLVTIAGKMTKADGWIDFAESADACRWRIHGLTPWPGVTAIYAGQPLKLLRAGPSEDRTDAPPGVIVNAGAGLVACGGGTTLRLLEVQPPGKRGMEWAAFANGRRLGEGDRLESTRPRA